MRFGSALVVLCLLLAGCTAPEADDLAPGEGSGISEDEARHSPDGDGAAGGSPTEHPPDQENGTGPNGTPPAPTAGPRSVDLHYDEDFSQAEVEYNWNWTVAPGAKNASLYASMVPLHDEVNVTVTNVCFQYTVTLADGSTDSGGHCISDSDGVHVEPGALELASVSTMSEGEWVVKFESTYSQARFVMDVDVDYQ